MLFDENTAGAIPQPESDRDMDDTDDDGDYAAQAMREREQDEPAPIQMAIPIRLRVPDAPGSGLDIEALLDAGVFRRPATQQVPVDTQQHHESGARAKHNNGESFATECFGSELLHHAHHHRLRCGHDIITKEIEVCGKNCKPAVSAGVAPFEDAFGCTAKACKRKAEMFLPKRFGQRKSIVRKRTCRLSQVEGSGALADEQRIQELEKPTVADREKFKSGIANSDDQLPQAIRMTRQKAAHVDPAEELNALIEADPSWKCLLDFKGPGVMGKSNGKFVSRKEWNKEFGSSKVSKALFDLQINNKKFDDLGASEADLPEREVDEDPGLFLDTDCDCCNRQVFKFRFTCQVCPSIDFCAECYLLKRDAHSMKHGFAMLTEPVRYTSAAPEPAARKPGEEILSADKGKGRAQQVESQQEGQSVKVAVHVANGRKQKARIEKQKRYYKPTLRVQKREELKAATTQAQKDDIHRKYQAILEQQDERDEGGELSAGEEAAAEFVAKAGSTYVGGTRKSQRLKALMEELFGDSSEDVATHIV